MIKGQGIARRWNQWIQRNRKLDHVTRQHVTGVTSDTMIRHIMTLHVVVFIVMVGATRFVTMKLRKFKERETQKMLEGTALQSSWRCEKHVLQLHCYRRRNDSNRQKVFRNDWPFMINWPHNSIISFLDGTHNFKRSCLSVHWIGPSACLHSRHQIFLATRFFFK